MKKLLCIILIFIISVGAFGCKTEPSETGKERERIYMPQLSALEFEFDEDLNKPVFTMSGEKFLPYIKAISVSEPALNEAVNQGYNIVYVSFNHDILNVNGKENLRKFFDAAKNKGIGVICEFSYGDIALNYCVQNPETNMHYSDGRIVEHYPDFLNEKLRAEYIRRYVELAEFVSQFKNAPVIAICIGAYDGYHIPEVETHVDFTVPEHTEANMTWLPYGEHVRVAFIEYLREKGVTEEELGVISLSDIELPDKQADCGYKMWSLWLSFRSEYYVEGFIRELVIEVRENSGLPVTMTLDLCPWRFTDWGTSVYNYADIFDFVIAFYYNINIAEDTIRKYFSLINSVFNANGVPIISLLEFSSYMGTSPCGGDDYAMKSAPYVSGFMFGYGGNVGMGEEREVPFYNTIKQYGNISSLPVLPKAKIAVYLSKFDSYIFDKDWGTWDISFVMRKTDYDVIYDHEKLDQEYKIVFIPDDQPNLEKMIADNSESFDAVELFFESQGQTAKNACDRLKELI